MFLCSSNIGIYPSLWIVARSLFRRQGRIAAFDYDLLFYLQLFAKWWSSTEQSNVFTDQGSAQQFGFDNNTQWQTLLTLCLLTSFYQDSLTLWAKDCYPTSWNKVKIVKQILMIFYLCICFQALCYKRNNSSHGLHLLWCLQCARFLADSGHVLHYALLHHHEEAN